jgi:hypothetical protein
MSLLVYFCDLDLVGISVGIGSNRRRKLLQLVMVLGDCRPGAGHGNASQENSSSLVRDKCDRNRTADARWNRIAMRGGDRPPSEPRTCDRTSFAPETTSKKCNKRNRRQMKTEQNQRS